MSETLFLTLAGELLGLVLAVWGVKAIKSLCPEDITRFQEIQIDQGSLFFVLAITVCTAGAGLLMRSLQAIQSVSLGFKTDHILTIGLMVGFISALTLNHFIEWALFGVSASDPISFGASVLVLVAAALVACLLPALRATRIDPIRTLRE